jgi:hypothetical protein
VAAREEVDAVPLVAGCAGWIRPWRFASSTSLRKYASRSIPEWRCKLTANIFRRVAGLTTSAISA